MTYNMGMASLSTPLSVRLSEEDTAFLAGLEMEGAVTASDKIRGLIRQARQRAASPDSFPVALALSHEHLAAAVRSVRLIEEEIGAHSDVTAGLMTTAEEFLALALAAPRAGDATLEDLVRYEVRLVACASRMTEQLLRWAVTPNAPAYDPQVVATRISAISDLMKLITATPVAR